MGTIIVNYVLINIFWPIYALYQAASFPSRTLLTSVVFVFIHFLSLPTNVLVHHERHFIVLTCLMLYIMKGMAFDKEMLYKVLVFFTFYDELLFCLWVLGVSKLKERPSYL